MLSQSMAANFDEATLASLILVLVLQRMVLVPVRGNERDAIALAKSLFACPAEAVHVCKRAGHAKRRCQRAP